MPGQYKTRRNAETGQIESVPEAEQGALKAAAEGIKPPPPAVRPQDVEFVNAGLEPPPVPPVAPPVQPPPPPPRSPPVQPPPEPGNVAAEAAGTGAVTGGAAGGAFAGGLAAFYLAKKFVDSKQSSPVGTLEGGHGRSQDDGHSLLKQLLEVQREVARLGTPIRDQVTTIAKDSRL